MILIDANLILYAHDTLNPRHARARQWWDAQLSGAERVALCWPVLTAFARISTNRRVFQRPLTMEQAISHIDAWLAQPCVYLIRATDAHWAVLRDMLSKGQALGNLVTDAHLAALAIEHGCELYSTDLDFSRFPGLRWRNPLE